MKYAIATLLTLSAQFNQAQAIESNDFVQMGGSERPCDPNHWRPGTWGNIVSAETAGI